jgi:hypothetical protein
MKKALISALLVVSAAFAPCVPSAVDLPERIYEVASATAGPLFWQVYDEMLSHGLSQVTTTSLKHEGQAGGDEALTCFFIHLFIHRAINGSLTAAEKMDVAVMSIPRQLIRRIGRA